MISMIFIVIFCYLFYMNLTNITLKKISKASLPNLFLIEDNINMSTTNIFKSNFNYTSDHNIYVYIDSNGGDTESGNAIIMEILKSDKDVTCIAKRAELIAFDIFSICNTRYVLENSVLVQHEITYTIENDNAALTFHIFDPSYNQILKFTDGDHIVKSGFADEVIIFE